MRIHSHYLPAGAGRLLRGIPVVLAMLMLLASPLHAHELRTHGVPGGEMVAELSVDPAAAPTAHTEPLPHPHPGGDGELDCLLCHLVASTPPVTSNTQLSTPTEAFPSPPELKSVASTPPSSAPFPPRGPPSH